MITEQALNDLLGSALAREAKYSAGLAAKRIVKILPTESEHDEIIGLTYEQIGAVLLAVGEIRSENPDTQEYVAIVHAGVANLNPALVVAKAITDRVYLAAYAKEGLIKQHTARKALDRIIQACENEKSFK